ncbi:MAG TPA: hypothetical protein VIL30_11520 [Ramlibacter sp.]|jgi:hypothetical protein
MQADRSAVRALALALASLLALAGCATTAPPPAPAAPAAPVPAQPEPAPAPPPAPQAVAPAPPPVQPRPPAHPADLVLAYADRVRGMPAPELAQEIQRLGDSGYAPVRALQLAVALGQSRYNGNLARAQSLLQRVQQDPEAQPLHALARLLAAQFTEQRRLEEQAERQAQQVRDNQRRIEQLNDRLEAVRAIERSLPSRPRRDAPVATPPVPAPTQSSGARGAPPRGGTP